MILIAPGLACTAQDVPGSSFLRLAISRGFRVAVMGRRAHEQRLKAARFNLFGDEDDAADPRVWIDTALGATAARDVAV